MKAKGFKSILKIMAEDSAQFDSSLEATEFMEKIQGMLNDKRLINWCWETDNNYGDPANAVDRLKAMSKLYNDFLSMMYSLDDAETSDAGTEEELPPEDETPPDEEV